MAMLYPYLITRWRQRAELFPTGQYYAHVYPHDGAREQNYFPMGGVIPIFHHMMAPESRFFFSPMGYVIPAFDHRTVQERKIISQWLVSYLYLTTRWRQSSFFFQPVMIYPHLTTEWRQRAGFPKGQCFTAFDHRVASESRIIS